MQLGNNILVCVFVWVCTCVFVYKKTFAMSILSTTGPERQNCEFSQGFIIFFHSLDSSWMRPKQKSPTWKKAAIISLQKLKSPCFQTAQSPCILQMLSKTDTNVTWTKQHQDPALLCPELGSYPRPDLNTVLQRSWEKIWLQVKYSVFLASWTWKKIFFFWRGGPGHGLWVEFCLGLGNISLDLTGIVNFTISIKFHHFYWNFVSSEGFWPAFHTSELQIWQALAVFHSTF